MSNKEKDIPEISFNDYVTDGYISTSGTNIGQMLSQEEVLVSSLSEKELDALDSLNIKEVKELLVSRSGATRGKMFLALLYLVRQGNLKEGWDA